MIRRLGPALLVGPLLLTAGALLTAATAHAKDTLSTVASTLRATSVYVDPDLSDPARTLTDDQADALSTQIAQTGVPVYVAVMTAATAGTAEPSDALTAVYGAVGADGVYAVVVDGRFRASSTGTRADDVEAMATAAANANRGDLPGALQDFVGQVGDAYGSGSGVPTNPASALVPLGIGAAVLGGGGYWLYRRSKAASAARTAEVRSTLDEDVTAYGELVAGLDTDDPQLAGEGQRDAQQALDAYEKAKAAATAMARPEDARTVTEALEEGRYHLACVEARRNGTPLPERRPPCFVDPRHGPSTQDMEWAPDGGTTRPVPVCAACATQLAQGQLPAAREVEVSGRRVPYWRAGGAYQPYATGYYSRFDGVLPAILIGSMMGGMMGGGGLGGAQAGSGAGADGDGGDGGWGGGWGGSDFGGGGGGLGGGDFGGGDFGGGGDF